MEAVDVRPVIPANLCGHGVAKSTCIANRRSLDCGAYGLGFWLFWVFIQSNNRLELNNTDIGRAHYMSEKIMEILVLLMQHMQDEQGHFDDISDISEILTGQGYTHQEVTTALSWLFERLHERAEPLIDTAQPLRSKPNRILHSIEKLVISPEAYGYLIQLRGLGLIDDIQMEMLIERAMLTGARHISQKDMKSIAASILLNSEGATWLPLQDASDDMNDAMPFN
ncbi:uncharacterized protein METZ01_LOCUS301226 [marine metagenome]|uniref:DUF494 family protein n=1 Tax=marine metagenome TaxID=408172 RepID=A0A382MLV0_9ZZZZ